MNGLDSYSRQMFYLFGPHFDSYQSLNRLPIWNSQNCSMFPLAFVAGWLEGHWWGFISRNYVVWPTSFLMNVFIALKGSHFWFYIIMRQKPAWHNIFLKIYKRWLSSLVPCMVSHQAQFVCNVSHTEGQITLQIFPSGRISTTKSLA